jgi:hypothetical protein
LSKYFLYDNIGKNHSMAKEINFLFSLSSDLTDRVRVIANREKNRILGFTVQYEAYIKNRWKAIVRYDTAHGFAHKDIIHPNGKVEKQPLYFPNLNLAFTFAIQDLKTLWRWYKESYEREGKNE